MFKFLGFLGGDVSSQSLLGRDAVQWHGRIPTFRRSTLHLSRWNDNVDLRKVVTLPQDYMASQPRRWGRPQPNLPRAPSLVGCPLLLIL